MNEPFAIDINQIDINKKLSREVRTTINDLSRHMMLTGHKPQLKLDLLVLLERIDWGLDVTGPITVGEVRVNARKVLEREVNETLGSSRPEALHKRGILIGCTNQDRPVRGCHRRRCDHVCRRLARPPR